jgi:hypothetical protein
MAAWSQRLEVTDRNDRFGFATKADDLSGGGQR